MISCRTLSVIEVGTSTWRQISGSVCRNSIRTVAISLTLSDPVFILAGLMRLVWRPGTGSSRVGAARACGYRGSLWGALLGEVQKCRAAHNRSSVSSYARLQTSRIPYPFARRRATPKWYARFAIRRICTLDSGDHTIVDIPIVFSK
jgi:hypothetical protein